MAVLHDSGGLLPRDAAASSVGTPDEQKQIVELVRQGLDEGGLGIGMGIAYVPKASREEILEVFRLAAQRRIPIYVHMRNGGPVEPGVIDALQEVIANAAATGRLCTSCTSPAWHSPDADLPAHDRRRARRGLGCHDRSVPLLPPA